MAQQEALATSVSLLYRGLSLALRLHSAGHAASHANHLKEQLGPAPRF